MKKIFLLLIVFLIFIPVGTYAQEYTHIEDEDLFNNTTDEIISGSFSLNPIDLLQKGINGLLNELKESRAEMISLLVIAALSGVLQILKSSGGETGISESAFFVCFMLMTMSALRIFGITVGYAVNVMNELSDFVNKLSPVFMVLLASGGSVTSVAAFHPILSGAVYVMTLLVDKCIVPLVYLSAVLGIVGHITPKLQLTAFTKLIRSTGKWILTAALTVFSGVTALYGFSAPVLDAVALKTAKFAVGSFVPVVGGILSDTVETVLSGTQLMKNAVGTAGIVSIGALCIVPVFKIASTLIMLEICAAAAEPLSDKRIMEMLKDIAASISLVLGMVITELMLFVICIGIILGATA